MTSFPIAVGTGPRHTSSRPYPKFDAENLPDFTGQMKQDNSTTITGDGLYDETLDTQDKTEYLNDVFMTVGSNYDDSLAATIFLKYHFLPKNDYWTVEKQDFRDFEDCNLSSQNQTYNNIARGEIEPVNGNIFHLKCNDMGDNDDWGENLINCKNKVNTMPTAMFSSPDLNTHKPHYVIAELRVHITSNTENFESETEASSSRETKCKVPLGIMRRVKDVNQQNSPIPPNNGDKNLSRRKSLSYRPNLAVVFSANQSHLACLIPLPRYYEPIHATQLPLCNQSSTSVVTQEHSTLATSTVVVFRIQTQSFTLQQKLRTQKQFPPLPIYIMKKTPNNNHGSYSNEEVSMPEQKMSKEKDDRKNSTISDERIEDASPQDDPYIKSSSTLRSRGNSLFYVAHQPRIVRLPQYSWEHPSSRRKNTAQLHIPLFQSKQKVPTKGYMNTTPSLPPLQSATSMCDMPEDHYRGNSTSAGSALLIGTIDGSLLTVDYMLARVKCILLSADDDSDDKRNNNPIIHVAQCPPLLWKPLDAYGEEQGSESKGRVAIVRRDGNIILYGTSFVPPLAEFSSHLKYSSNCCNVDSLRTNGAPWSRLETQRFCSLQIIMEKLFASDEMENIALRLPYVRVKWLNPLIVVLLTRSPCLDVEWMLKDADKVSNPTEVTVAQVWEISEPRLGDQTKDIGSTSSDTLKLVSELKWPCREGDPMKEIVHHTYSLCERASLLDKNIADLVLVGDCASLVANCESSMSISYHPPTNCLALTSLIVTPTTCSSLPNSRIPQSRCLRVQPFCTLWDWKRNILGFTSAGSTSFCFRLCQSLTSKNVYAEVLPSFFSRFYIGNDHSHGLTAVHLYEAVSSSQKFQIIKDVFTLGLLSPSHGDMFEGSTQVSEPSALLLLPDSVLYPFLSMSSTSHEAYLQWEECLIPTNYLSSNGPCHIVAVARESGQSIAIAASRGLCVLDLSRRKWWEEKRENMTISLDSFPAQSPRWKLFSNLNDEQRFRVVNMVWWERDSGKDNKNLKDDRSDDVLLAIIEYSHMEGYHLVSWTRRRLGFDENQIIVEVSAMKSEINEMNEGLNFGIPLPHYGLRVSSTSMIADPLDKKRALLLVTFMTARTNQDDSNFKYVIYQLQSFPKRQPEMILARSSACGSIDMIERSKGSYVDMISGIFIAGGSFSFQLDDNNTPDIETETIAVIGVATISQGLFAVCVNQIGPLLCRLIIQNEDIDPDGLSSGSKSQIVAYWICDTFADEYEDRIAWNISNNKGKVYCWSVPCRRKCHHCAPSKEKRGCIQPEICFESHDEMGEMCYLGYSSMWMSGASTNENEIALGPFSSSFKSIIFAGQRSKKLSQDILPHESKTSIHVSNCIISAPSFTPMLYVSFLGLAVRSNNLCFYQHYIKSTLQRSKNLGSGLSALRIIIFKTIDLLSDSVSKGETCPIWRVGKDILYNIVLAAKETFDLLTVTGFFLSIGRQLEPQQFNLIFPLPAFDSIRFSSVDDLFNVSSSRGALSTALSALPLFSCHSTSQERVIQLIYHCLAKIEDSFKSDTFDTSSTEEEKFVHQLFWFGVKLEDAIRSLHPNRYSMHENKWSGSNSTLERLHDVSESFSVTNSSSEDWSETESSEESDADFFSKMTTKLLPMGTRPYPFKVETEENDIHVAASSFILSGFDSSSQTQTTNPILVWSEDEKKSCEAHSENTYSLTTRPNHLLNATVSGVVSLFICHAIGLCKTPAFHPNSHSGWKIVSIVALLLQGDRKSSTITCAASANARRISQFCTIEVPNPIRHIEDNADDLILQMLASLIIECNRQVQIEAAETIFNLVLLLLLQFDTCRDVQLQGSNLMIVGTVSGHICGRITELIDSSGDIHPLLRIYKLLLQKVPIIDQH